jgi:translation initiation factor IF-3
MSVIGPDGEELGVMTITEALRRARCPGLDLVEIRPEADPPVCKIFVRGRVLPEPVVEFEIRDNQIKEKE